MPLFVGLGFALGALLVYGFIAHPARKSNKSCQEDLKAAQALIESAQQERETLKQQVADSQYQLKELEKDLVAARNQ